MRESAIEKAVCDYARGKGVIPHKMQVGMGGSSGWPDRLFVFHGKIWFAEFKAPGKKPTPLQARIINELQQHKIHVYVIDDIDMGKRMVDGEVGNDYP